MRCERCEGTGKSGPERSNCHVCGGEGTLPENGSLYCYSCRGTGKTMACVDGIDRETGRHWGEVREVNCSTCRGKGNIEPERLRRMNEGAVMRRERLALGESQREAATRMGVDVVTLSQVEHGDLPASALKGEGDALG